MSTYNCDLRSVAEEGDEEPSACVEADGASDGAASSHDRPHVRFDAPVAEHPTPRSDSVLFTILHSPYGPTRKRLASAQNRLFRKPIGPKIDTEKMYQVGVIEGEPSLELSFALRRKLVTNDRLTLVMGIPSPAILEKNRLQYAQCPGAPIYSHEEFQRIAQNFQDAPLPYLRLDLDGIDAHQFDPDYHPIADVHATGNIIRDFFEAIGCEWLIAGFVFNASGSHGLVDRSLIRGHLEFVVGKCRLTLAQQERLVKLLNDKAEKAGYGRVFDENIYTPEHLLLTARPYLFDEDSNEPVAGPIFERVHLFFRENGNVAIPDEVLAELDKVGTRQTRQRPVKAAKKGAKPQASRTEKKYTKGSLNKHREALLAAIDQGNTHDPIRDLIHSIALHERSDRAGLILEHWRRKAIARIRATSTSPEAADARIEDHASPEAWAESHEGALRHAEKAYEIVGQGPLPVLPSVDEARDEVARSLERAVEQGLQFEKLLQDSELLRCPSFTVFTAPMGLGKSEYMRRALTYARTRGRRVWILTPTIELSAKACEKHRGLVAEELMADGWDETKARTEAERHVRHIQGRANLCIDKEWGALCEPLERSGQSPQSICELCPQRRYCPAFAQIGDDWNGIVYCQHAHATSKLMTLKADSKSLPDLVVIDEGLFSTLLGTDEHETKLRVADFTHVTGRAWIKAHVPKKGRVGKKVYGATDDLDRCLKALGRVIKGAQPFIMGSQLDWFAEPSGEGRNIDDACKLTKEWIWTLRDCMRLHMDKVAQAVLSGSDGGEDKRQAEELQQHLSVAVFVSNVFKGIKASLDSNRERVLALKTFQHKGAKYIHCQLRRALPSAFESVPIIVLDATPVERLYRRLVRCANWHHSVDFVDTPAQPGAHRLMQYADRPYGQSMFIHYKTGRIRKRNARKFRRFIVERAYFFEAQRRRGRMHGRKINGKHIDVLVVVQEEIEEFLIAEGLPENVSIRHFNAVRGLDDYKDVPCLIVVGRPMPTTFALADLEEAFSYDDLTVTDTLEVTADDWGTGSRDLVTADGVKYRISSERQSEERIEDIRQALVEAEVCQAIGRARIYNRSDDNPVEVHLFGTADVGLPPHQVRSWKNDADRDLGDISEAAGIFYQNSETARLAYGDWVPGGGKGFQAAGDAWRWGVALQAVQGTKLSPNLYRDSLYRFGDNLVGATVTFEGPRTSDGRAGYAQRVLIDRTLFSNGELAIAEVERKTGKEVTTFRWDDEASQGVEQGAVSL